MDETAWESRRADSFHLILLRNGFEGADRKAGIEGALPQVDSHTKEGSLMIVAENLEAAHYVNRNG